MQTESTAPDPASGDRITAVRVVELAKPAAGLIIRPDGTVGMAANKVAIVMGLDAAQAYEIGEAMLRLAMALADQPAKGDDLATVLAQVGPAGSA
jgi:hypothetical protein